MKRACNPSGIALAIVMACDEIRAEPNHTGTAQICADPAIRLMVNQLAYLVGNSEMSYDDYVDCRARCQTAVDHERAIKALLSRRVE
jgi:hypothetical protein